MLLKFYMCRNRPGIVPMLATSFQLPDHNPIVSHFARHTMWFICIDIFKIVNWNEPWVLKYTIIHHFLESGTRYWAGSMKSYHRVKVGNIAHMVSIAHCVKWVISRTLTAILPDFEFQWLVPVKWILWRTSYHTQEIIPQKHILYC